MAVVPAFHGKQQRSGHDSGAVFWRGFAESWKRTFMPQPPWQAPLCWSLGRKLRLSPAVAALSGGVVCSALRVVRVWEQ
jgi:hypothetical protein